MLIVFVISFIELCFLAEAAYMEGETRTSKLIWFIVLMLSIIGTWVGWVFK